MMKSTYLILLTLIVTASCGTITKENDIFVTEKPKDPIVIPPPGEFVVTTGKITDRAITLDWTKPSYSGNDKLSYSVAYKDSVFAYDLTQNTYTVNNLLPDRDYNFNVVALNSYLNKKVVPITAHTQKSFIEKVITFNYNIRRFNFERIIKSSDNGYIISGCITEYGFGNKMFLMKLSSDLAVVWKSEFNYPLDGFNNEAIVECADHNILFLTDFNVYKYSPQGDIIWVYPRTSNVRFFSSIVQNSDGGFYLIGHAPNAPYPVGNQYVVIKLSSTGTELFQKTITEDASVRIKQIMIDDNKLVLLGTITDNQVFITKLDLSGNLISSQKFFNKYYSFCKESPYSMVVTKDNNYLVMTNLNGNFNSNYYSNLPRYFKVSKTGTLIWDQYQNLSSGGFDSNIHGINVMDNGKFLSIINDDRGFSLVLLNELGNVERHYKFYGYQQGLFIDVNAQGKYVYFTVNLDEIFILDPVGYWE